MGKLSILSILALSLVLVACNDESTELDKRTIKDAESSLEVKDVAKKGGETQDKEEQKEQDKITEDVTVNEPEQVKTDEVAETTPTMQGKTTTQNKAPQAKAPTPQTNTQTPQNKTTSPSTTSTSQIKTPTPSSTPTPEPQPVQQPEPQLQMLSESLLEPYYGRPSIYTSVRESQLNQLRGSVSTYPQTPVTNGALLTVSIGAMSVDELRSLFVGKTDGTYVVTGVYTHVTTIPYIQEAYTVEEWNSGRYWYNKALANGLYSKSYSGVVFDMVRPVINQNRLEDGLKVTRLVITFSPK